MEKILKRGNEKSSNLNIKLKTGKKYLTKWNVSVFRGRVWNGEVEVWNEIFLNNFLRHYGFYSCLARHYTLQWEKAKYHLANIKKANDWQELETATAVSRTDMAATTPQATHPRKFSLLSFLFSYCICIFLYTLHSSKHNAKWTYLKNNNFNRKCEMKYFNFPVQRRPNVSPLPIQNLILKWNHCNCFQFNMKYSISSVFYGNFIPFSFHFISFFGITLLQKRNRGKKYDLSTKIQVNFWKNPSRRKSALKLRVEDVYVYLWNVIIFIHR